MSVGSTASFPSRSAWTTPSTSRHGRPALDDPIDPGQVGRDADRRRTRARRGARPSAPPGPPPPRARARRRSASTLADPRATASTAPSALSAACGSQSRTSGCSVGEVGGVDVRRVRDDEIPRAGRQAVEEVVAARAATARPVRATFSAASASASAELSIPVTTRSGVLVGDRERDRARCRCRRRAPAAPRCLR